MFSRAAVFISLALLLVGQVHAVPYFGKRSDVIARSAEPLDSINIIERQIPAEVAVKAPNGVVVPYSKREEAVAKRDVIPAEIAVKAPDGIVVPYSKREEEELAKRQIPEELPVKAPDGKIVPYNKREVVERFISPEIPSRSLNGVIELY